MKIKKLTLEWFGGEQVPDVEDLTFIWSSTQKNKNDYDYTFLELILNSTLLVKLFVCLWFYLI